MPEKNTVLVLVAHADDETLGLAGTIVKHVNQGDRVYAVSMTDGVGARREESEENLHKRRQAAIS